jgi:hypothetical protein
MTLKRTTSVALAVLLLASGAAHAAPIVYTSGFIADATRTHFNGFEAMPLSSGNVYTGGPGPYIEGGISVRQVSGDAGNDIWGTFFRPEGTKGWYPNGGDSGYTEIRMADGDQFGNVGFFRGSGNGTHSFLYYMLLLNGGVVSSGAVAHSTAATYLGFGGGGFDTIFLRDGTANQSMFNDSHNALAIDAIEVSALTPVPEPASMTLLGVGLAGLGARRWRQRRRA